MLFRSLYHSLLHQFSLNSLRLFIHFITNFFINSPSILFDSSSTLSLTSSSILLQFSSYLHPLSESFLHQFYFNPPLLFITHQNPYISITNVKLLLLLSTIIINQK